SVQQRSALQHLPTVIRIFPFVYPAVKVNIIPVQSIFGVLQMVFGPIVPSLTGLHIHAVLASFEHPEGEYRRRRIRTGVFGGLLLLTPINASSQQAIFSTLHEFPDNL